MSKNSFFACRRIQLISFHLDLDPFWLVHLELSVGLPCQPVSCGRAHDPSANHQHIKPEEVKIFYTCLYFLLCSVCGFIKTFAGSHLSQSLFGVRFLPGETPAVGQLVANLSPPSPAYPFPLCASPWHHVGRCRAYFQTIQPT